MMHVIIDFIFEFVPNVSDLIINSFLFSDEYLMSIKYITVIRIFPFFNFSLLKNQAVYIVLQILKISFNQKIIKLIQYYNLKILLMCILSE